MKSSKLLHHCLYFSTGTLARALSRMAEREFSECELSPSHAFLMMLVNERPGINQKELAEHLSLAQSTITRFVDLLVEKGYVERQSSGREVLLRSTKSGLAKQNQIEECWKNLYHSYSKVLGEQEGEALNLLVGIAAKKLNQSQ